MSHIAFSIFATVVKLTFRNVIHNIYARDADREAGINVTQLIDVIAAGI